MNILDKIISETIHYEVGKLINEAEASDAQDGKKRKFIRRKVVNGGSDFQDYDDYERTHAKTTKSDADSIRNAIDLDNTDLRQVAKDVYTDHTDNGGQSQLRKVLKGERPMTNDVAQKLSRMISRGNVAVKKCVFDMTKK